MLLREIFVNSEKFQKRDTPFSARTVEAIVTEGINLAKFDPLPLFRVGKQWCVGGDGHSRYEAIRRLAAEKPPRLPVDWKVGVTQDKKFKGVEFNIPHREVTEALATELSWSANLSRDNFSPCEEAGAYRDALALGKSYEVIAKQAHKTVTYVKNMLPLNVLIQQIRERVGKHPDGGGIDKQIAQAMGERFVRFKITPAQQQELWLKVFCKADLTVNFVRKIIDTINPEMQKKMSQGALFEIPASVTGIVESMKGRADGLRQLRRGLAWLIQCNRQTPDVMIGVDILSPLKRYLDKLGAKALEAVKGMESDEAGLVGQICTTRR